jgi:hypothetical protein
MANIPLALLCDEEQSFAEPGRAEKISLHAIAADPFRSKANAPRRDPAPALPMTESLNALGLNVREPRPPESRV